VLSLTPVRLDHRPQASVSQFCPYGLRENRDIRLLVKITREMPIRWAVGVLAIHIDRCRNSNFKFPRLVTLLKYGTDRQVIAKAFNHGR
jgi:hypothetical protein